MDEKSDVYFVSVFHFGATFCFLANFWSVRNFRILYEEIDYINEGKNADRFRRDFRNIKWVRVPVCFQLDAFQFPLLKMSVCCVFMSHPHISWHPYRCPVTEDIFAF